MRALVLVCLMLVGVPAARAVDGMSIELGASNSSHTSVDLARVGIQWNWGKRWALGPNWHIGGFWDLSLGYWNNDSAGRSNSSMADVGFTPTFRLQQTQPGTVAPYLEAAIGFHLLSDSSVSDQRRFGSSFQFGDHVGFGIRFGPRHAFDLGYRYQHLSNAGLKQPNSGINFHQARFQYHF